MQQNRTSHLGLIFILGLLSMLMPLAIDMYLPSMPVIAAQFGVESGSVQMTLSAYMLGFAFGQLFYGPMSDSIGRKAGDPVGNADLRHRRLRLRHGAIDRSADRAAFPARPGGGGRQRGDQCPDARYVHQGMSSRA